MDSIESIMDYYKVFNSDTAYYHGLISTYSGDIKKVKERIKYDIKESWSKYKIDWFIKFANSNPVGDVLDLMDNYSLELNPVVVQNLVTKCPKLKEYLDKLLAKRDQWTEDELEKDFSVGIIFDMVYNYAIISNRIDVGSTLTKYAETVNYDAYIGDSTRTYIKEIQSLQAFDKNNERIVNYKEYKKLAKATDELGLAKKYEKEAEKIRKQIIEGNLCLVIPTATKYRNLGVDFLDLLQEGSIGIMTALDKFDPQKSFSFSTYATWWIKQGINRYVFDNSRTVRVPVHLHEHYAKIKTFQDTFIKLNSREPSVNEISKGLSMSRARVEHILASFENPVSLDAPVKNDSNEDSSDLYTFLADETDYDEKLFAEEYVEKFFKGLKKQEEFVFRMRFGIRDGKDPRFESPHTLEAVGNELHITRERVRQIEARALRKFRNKEGIVVDEPDSKKYKKFWDYFIGVDKELVERKLKLLSERDMKCLQQKFGDDLETFIMLDKKRNNRAFSVLNKVKKMVMNPNYRPAYCDGNLKVIIECPLTEIVSMDIETIINYLGNTSTSLQLLKKVFGEDLSLDANPNAVNEEETKLVLHILNNLNTSVIKNNGKTIFELFEYSKDDIDDVLKSIDVKYFDLLIKLFGQSLDKKADFFLLSSDEYVDWLKLVTILKRGVAKLRKGKKYFSIEKIASVVNKTPEEMRDIFNNLDKDSKIYSIITKRMNCERLSYTEKNLFDHWCNDLKNDKNIKQYNISDSYLVIVLSSLDITEEELMLIYNTLDQSTKIYDILTRVIDGILIEDEDATILKTWLNMKQRNKSSINIRELPKTDKTRLVLNDINYTSNELLNYLSNIPYNSKKYQAVVKFIREDAMESKELSSVYNWKSQMKKVYQINPEIKSSVVLSFDGLSEEMVKMVELRIGLYDGTIYSISEISDIFNIPEDTVIEYLSTAIAIIEKNSIDKGMKLKLIKS